HGSTTDVHQRVGEIDPDVVGGELHTVGKANVERYAVGLPGHQGCGECTLKIFAPAATEERLAPRDRESLVYNDPRIAIAGAGRLVTEDVPRNTHSQSAEGTASIEQVGGGTGITDQVLVSIAPWRGLA